MRKSDLRRLIVEQRDLPTLPTVAVKVLHAVRDDGEDFEALTRIITSDQSLASRVLSYANTPRFRQHGPVNDLNRAIHVLGTRTIRNLVVGASVFRIFQSRSIVEGFNLADFWRHCIGCSLAARSLATILGYPDPEEAFAAGLLHDLGKLFFADRIPKEFAAALEEHHTSGASLTEVEEDIIGVSHTQAGKWLAEHWGLPRNIADALWLHHQPLSGGEYEISHSLPSITRLADALCLLYRIGFSGNYRMVSPSELTSVSKQIDDQTLRDIVAEVIETLDDVCEFLGLDHKDEDLFLTAVQLSNQELASLNEKLQHQQESLTREHQLLQVICEMSNRIEPTMPLAHAVDIIAQSALKGFNVDRAICFIINREENVLEGRIAQPDRNKNERITLPLSAPPDAETKQAVAKNLRREEIDILEESLLALPQGPEVWGHVVGTLQRGGLGAYPLVCGSVVLGQVLIDYSRNPEAQEIARSVLDLFMVSAAQCINRCILHAEVTESAEELARMARKAEESQIQLYRAQRLASVGKLAAGCAHEINNPLAVISGTAQMFLRQVSNDEAKSKQLQTIISQANRITKIINDLMGLARPAEPRIEYTDLPKVIDDTINLLVDRRGFDKIQFIREYDRELPKTLADPKQLEQVFINLFMNARDAMPNGGEIRVSVKTERERRFLVTSVTDTGEGISSDRIEHIFDPFFTTKKEGEGTGLGLAICHSIVEAHRGTMQVQSTPGVGTTFRINIPIRQRTTISDFRKELVKSARKKPAIQVVESRKRVLLVDDEEQIRTILAQALIDEGYDVSQAGDGVQGMRLLGESRYDVALIDIRMPHKDGVEMLGEIRQVFPQMPVLVVTGLASDREIKDAVAAGAYAVIKKPFDIDELIYTVRRAIANPQKKQNSNEG